MSYEYQTREVEKDPGKEFVPGGGRISGYISIPSIPTTRDRSARLFSKTLRQCC